MIAVQNVDKPREQDQVTPTMQDMRRSVLMEVWRRGKQIATSRS